MRRAVVLGAVVAAAGAAALARRKPAIESHGHDLTGAPFPLRSDGRRRRESAAGSARTVPPRWEPRALTALGEWEPAPPRSLPGRLAVYLWAAPLTAGGLVAGAAGRGSPRLRDGVVLFAGVRGLPGAFLRSRRYAAATLGHVVIAVREPSEPVFAHELVHVRQAERLGPLLGPLYLGLLAVYGYARHPLERAPRAAARRVATGRA